MDSSSGFRFITDAVVPPLSLGYQSFVGGMGRHHAMCERGIKVDEALRCCSNREQILSLRNMKFN
jgi:hypothetical protein